MLKISVSDADYHLKKELAYIYKKLVEAGKKQSPDFKSWSDKLGDFFELHKETTFIKLLVSQSRREYLGSLDQLVAHFDKIEADKIQAKLNAKYPKIIRMVEKQFPLQHWINSPTRAQADPSFAQEPLLPVEKTKSLGSKRS